VPLSRRRKAAPPVDGLAAVLLALFLFGFIGSQLISPKRADMGANPLNLRPTWAYPLGTDGLGRDMLAVMVIALSGSSQ